MKTYKYKVGDKVAYVYPFAKRKYANGKLTGTIVARTNPWKGFGYPCYIVLTEKEIPCPISDRLVVSFLAGENALKKIT